MKKLLLLIIGLSFLIYVLPFILQGDLDRFNPLYNEKNVYALVEEVGIPDHNYPGRYKYLVNGIDEAGSEGEYKVGTSDPNVFKRKTYLKIHVKGKYVFSYEEVQEKEIPKKIREKLRK
ncbi:YxeA family protein [Bacillus cereus]|uniref:YxeA family protein n=1 Tax=Bacillus cereus TaxID=1396 RepID=UPI002E1DCBFD|nr:YxeA family protein [Bacillus thuringiensis]HDR7760649.1 YxeA family protein [Bacillus cereus]HDR7762921.1 YxeA family protein [Bacillus cereus]